MDRLRLVGTAAATALSLTAFVASGSAQELPNIPEPHVITAVPEPRVITAKPLPSNARQPLRPAYMIEGAKLLSGPGVHYGLVQVIPEGTTVGVAKCSGDWCEVVWKNRRGFAPAETLSIAGADRASGYFLPPYGYEEPDYYGGPSFFWGASFACCGHRGHHRRW
jgi:hypothetical protein